MRFILARSIKKKKKKKCNAQWLFINHRYIDVLFSRAAFKEARSQGYRTLRYLRKTCHMGLKVHARELLAVIHTWKGDTSVASYLGLEV